MDPQSHEWFLGSVEFDVTPKAFTKLRPFARSAPDRRNWDMFENEPSSAFPTQGLVCWFGAPPNVRKHQLFEFQIAAISGFDGVNKLDKFHVTLANSCVEVVEAPFDDEFRVRDALLNDGIALSPAPRGRTILRVSEDMWLGPFDLQPRASRLWAPGEELKLDAVPSFTVLPYPIGSVRLDETTRQVLLTCAGALVAQHFRNWQSDSEVLLRMLKRLHKLDNASFNSIGLTYKALEAFVAAASNASLLPDQQMRERALLERVRGLQRDLPLTPLLLDQIIETLSGFGEVKQRLEERIAAIGLERKAEIEARISGERQQLDRVQQELSALRLEHESIAKKIVTSRKVAEGALAETDAAIQEKIRQIREAPAKAIAELLASSSIYSSLIPAKPSTCIGNARILRADLPESTVSLSAPGALEALAHGLMQAGINPGGALPLLAALTVGLLPIVGGDAADEALRVAGDCLCGSSRWCLPVSPATIALSDLLGAQALGGLSDIMEYARTHSENVSLAVLEGIDLGASDGYFPPLVTLVSGSGRLPLLVASEQQSPDWPSNLMLAVTVACTSSASPLPRRTFERVPLILFDWLGSGQSSFSSARSRLGLSAWREVRAAGMNIEPSRQEYAGINPPTARLATRFRSAIRALQASADAEAFVQTHIIAPCRSTMAGELPPDFSPLARLHFNFARKLVSEKTETN